MKNTVHANNFGFINDQDYTVDGDRPVLAVIGDSYVEAAMVPYEETLQGRLAKSLASTYRVYSFAASGAPLSQYLAFAGYAKDKFKAQKMVFVIVSNDFDESLTKYKSAPGFHYFTLPPKENHELVRMDYTPSSTVRLLRHSRLALYLVTNLQLTNTISTLFSDAPAAVNVGQTSADANEERLNDSKYAVDAFLALLPEYSGLQPSDIIFVVDGLRPHLYSETNLKNVSKSYAAQMRDYFIAQALQQHFTAIDLTDAFIKDFEQHRQPFEFPKDGHWNGRGHGIAAQQTSNVLAQ
ncbi:hypothetical protein [Pseudodesulfovibrio sp. zrk46]|uniref:hypothetical protein n=1 Tax=Pseudodesulfovibrio sp. zrk46 TaxID=2725288 RepID=UPI0014496F0C|nr:hypothetical protein [Pseudodesulfovibrio sp. zrk46]QJB56606.1 hypothetical protein HFN16_09370 [Pseudodesulfovibrio sp. zrk46]